MSNRRTNPREYTRTRPQKSTYRRRPLPYDSLSAERQDTGEHIALVEIDWDTGTEYYSFVSVRSPSAYYQDLVASISPIRREVSIFGGSVSVGTATVGLVNRDRTFSIKWASTSFLGRKLRVKFVSIPLGLASAITLFEGKITDWELAGGIMTISARDNSFDLLFSGSLAQTIPQFTKTNFSKLLDGQIPALVPLVFGRISNTFTSSSGGFTKGYLVDNTGPFIYVLMARPCGAANADTPSIWIYGNQSTSIYSPATAVYNGVTYTIKSFATDQRDATRLNEAEVTAYIPGITEDDSTSSTPILNAVRALEYFLITYGGLAAADFDTTLQTTSKNTITNQNYAVDFVTTNSPATLGAIIFDEDKVIGDVIEKFCSSFAMQLYTTREGKLATFVMTDNADPVADFTVDDETDIISGSFKVRRNGETASTLQTNFDFRSTFGLYGDSSLSSFYAKKYQYEIPGEKARIGNIAVRRELNLPYNRSVVYAIEVSRCYAELFKSQAQIAEFELPIRFFRSVELNRYVGVTHWQGPSAAGGYANVTARITGITITVEPHSAKIGLTVFKRAALVTAADQFNRAASGSLGTDWTESEPGASILTIPSQADRLLGEATGNSAAIATHTAVLGNNQLARLRLIGIGGGADTRRPFGGVFVRGSGTYDNFTGYAAIYNFNTSLLELRRLSSINLVNNATDFGTLLGSLSQAVAFGDEWELRADGTSIEVWFYSQNAKSTGKVIGTITDSNIVSGKAGIIFGRTGGTGVIAASSFEVDWFEARDF